MTEESPADGAPATTDASAVGSRRAHVESDVEAPGTVAAAIAPDDTTEIHTRAEGGRVVTDVERSTTGGLEATIDDYVVALDVATAVVGHARDEHVTGDGRSAPAEEEAEEETEDEQHDDRHDTHSP